ncbi:hypothetical protein BD779DRAFT_1579448 [Infundibulicybe gibba]|nr:hypothetical protein BD779DRAFT_1579448 [Infundibulicybe gibba]
MYPRSQCHHSHRVWYDIDRRHCSRCQNDLARICSVRVADDSCDIRILMCALGSCLPELTAGQHHVRPCLPNSPRGHPTMRFPKSRGRLWIQPCLPLATNRRTPRFQCNSQWFAARTPSRIPWCCIKKFLGHLGCDDTDMKAKSMIEAGLNDGYVPGAEPAAVRSSTGTVQQS